MLRFSIIDTFELGGVTTRIGNRWAFDESEARKVRKWRQRFSPSLFSTFFIIIFSFFCFFTIFLKLIIFLFFLFLLFSSYSSILSISWCENYSTWETFCSIPLKYIKTSKDFPPPLSYCSHRCHFVLYNHHLLDTQPDGGARFLGSSRGLPCPPPPHTHTLLLNPLFFLFS